MTVVARPFLKYAGGKTSLLPKILPRLPAKIRAYYEPFVGAGAVFFALATEKRFERAIIGDSNKELMLTYGALSTNPSPVIAHLRNHVLAHCERYYYLVRADNPKTNAARAARFIYLNRTCFTPGAKVLTEDERLIDIERVEVGQRLWGGRVVQEKLAQAFDGTVLRIKVQGNAHTLSATDDHPFLVIPKRKTRVDGRSTEQLAEAMVFRPASALEVGDFLLLPSIGTKHKKVPWSIRRKGDRSHSKRVAGYVAVRIKEITPLAYNGTVHNLEVDGDHLLCVDGVVSHNCFNGLYRVNRKGEFNVPFGSYANPTICDDELLRAVGKALSPTTMCSIDFEKTVVVAAKGDAVYFDPPYAPLSPTSSFTGYTPGGFGAKDQERLRDVAETLIDRGVHVLLSNSDTPFVRELYRGFKIEEVTAPRRINSKGGKRGNVGELLISGKNR